MLRAILFDFNGVLVDDEPIHLELFQRVLAEEGVELTAEGYHARYLAFDDRDCFTAVLEAAGEPATAGRVERLIARKSAYYDARIRQRGFPVFVGAAELIAEVAGDGRTLGLVSGALRGEIAGALEQLGLRSRFEIIVAAEDVERSKPDPQGYRLAFEHLATSSPPASPIRPREVIVIEDTPEGIEAAAACALTTVGVAHTHAPERLGAADLVVDRIADLCLGGLEALVANVSGAGFPEAGVSGTGAE